jgi:hypothetical protein
LIFISLLMLLAGCYPGGPEYTSDYDIIGTDHDPDYWNANSPSTYYMPDSLGWILDRENIDNSEDDLTRDYDAFILNEVANNLAALGYERVDTYNEADRPDLVVFTEALAVKNTTVSYIPWYPWYGYGGYWGGYWPYYGYGYPVVYSYSTGTILIEMADALNLDTEHLRINIVWLAAIDGLLRSSSVSNQEFVSQTIEQAFAQSPYLK